MEGGWGSVWVFEEGWALDLRGVKRRIWWGTQDGGAG